MIANVEPRRAHDGRFAPSRLKRWRNDPIVKAARKTGRIPDTAKTIYLSGPMKGYHEYNYPLFNRVAAELRAQGHTVYNPAQFQHNSPDGAFPIRKAFAEYCRFICEAADTIVLLPGWEKSNGSYAERALAYACGLEIHLWQEPT